MDKIKFKITGVSPLLMHNPRLSNPLDEYTRKLKKLSSLKKKTDENHAEMSDIEFAGGLYLSEQIGPSIPKHWLKACLIEGGKMQKNGTKIKQSVVILEDEHKLNYKGPRTLTELSADPSFRDIRSVSVGQSRVMRTRPKFPVGWNVTFEVMYDSELVNKDELVAAMNFAGQCKGLGDFRPEMGLFEVEVV